MDLLKLKGGLYFLWVTTWAVPMVALGFYIVAAPFYFLNKKIYISIKMAAAKYACTQFVTCAKYFTNGVTEYGARLEELAEKRCLVLANHLALMDHFILMTSFERLGQVSSKWMFVIYNIWMFTPLGFIWYLHGNYFVNGATRDRREALLRDMRRHMESYYHDGDFGWVIAYPEGSRLFLIQKANEEFEKKNDLSHLEHTTYPKLGAAGSILRVLAPKPDAPSEAVCGRGAPLEYLIDVTLGYPKGQVPNLADAAIGNWPNEESPNLAAHFEVVPITADLVDEGHLKKLLFQLYAKKDKLLAEYYRTGKFPGESRTATVPPTSVLLLHHICWLVLYAVNHQLWIAPAFRIAFRLVAGAVSGSDG